MDGPLRMSSRRMRHGRSRVEVVLLGQDISTGIVWLPGFRVYREMLSDRGD